MAGARKAALRRNGGEADVGERCKVKGIRVKYGRSAGSPAYGIGEALDRFLILSP